MLSITTDYARSTGDPSPYLKRIAAAGFSHVHWCHHWNTDFIYSGCEVDRIAAWFAEYGLALLDLHGATGPEKNWAAPEEYRRLAGVELVRNRLEMTARLGGHAVVMHAGLTDNPAGTPPGWDALKRSLDALEPFSRKLGVPIAVENTSRDWGMVAALLDHYPPDYLGLCYDSGHGNVDGLGLEKLAALKERLLCLHLHDNDGKSDQHRLPFTGTVDWPEFVRILASSPYTGSISMESNMSHEGIQPEEEFLARAFGAGTRLSSMLAAAGGPPRITP